MAPTATNAGSRFAYIDGTAELCAHLDWLKKKDDLGQDVFLLGWRIAGSAGNAATITNVVEIVRPPGPLKLEVALRYAQRERRSIEYVAVTADLAESDLTHRRELRNGTLVHVPQAAVRAAVQGSLLILDGIEHAERNVLPLLNNLLESREMPCSDGTLLVPKTAYDAATPDARERLRLVPVSPTFRVVALGAPVPPFAGGPLDPPFRSRFQARVVRPCAIAGFPAAVNDVLVAQRHEELAPGVSPRTAMALHGAIKGVSSVHLASLLDPRKPPEPLSLPSLPEASFPGPQWTRTQAQALSQMYHVLQAGCDAALVGPPGCGKSLIVAHLARMARRRLHVLPLYRDMAPSQLLQSLGTDESGNTAFEASLVVEAAQNGDWVVLDGLEAVAPSTLHQLSLLTHARYAVLPDGSLVQAAESFRLLGLCRGDAAQLPADVQTLFAWTRIAHVALSEAELLRVLGQFDGTPPWTPSLQLVRPLQKLVALVTSKSAADALRATGRFLTLPAQRRILKAASGSGENSVSALTAAVRRACLAAFLPAAQRAALEKALVESIGPCTEPNATEAQLEIKGQYAVAAKCQVRIATVPDATARQRIPRVNFVNNAHQGRILGAMLRDWAAGEHLLLVGNQGVGKNRLTDRFLAVLNRPRVYMQLHRDSNVAALTEHPTLVHGKLVYVPSPLVEAAERGDVCVIDEADKAPPHVLAVLRTFLCDGLLVLPSGARLVRRKSPWHDSRERLVHPSWRVIVLANRPGSLFLGNDFFDELGDCFAMHAVTGLDTASELELVRPVAKAIEPALLDGLLQAFHTLREYADMELVAYPFSTRELVHVLRHYDRFPADGISQALQNVFAFDAFDPATLSIVEQVFAARGIPLGVGKEMSVRLASARAAPAIALHVERIGSLGDSTFALASSSPLTLGQWSPKSVWPLACRSDTIEFSSLRTATFSELVAEARVPHPVSLLVGHIWERGESHLVFLCDAPAQLCIASISENALIGPHILRVVDLREALAGGSRPQDCHLWVVGTTAGLLTCALCDVAAGKLLLARIPISGNHVESPMQGSPTLTLYELPKHISKRAQVLVPPRTPERLLICQPGTQENAQLLLANLATLKTWSAALPVKAARFSNVSLDGTTVLAADERGLTIAAIRLDIANGTLSVMPFTHDQSNAPALLDDWAGAMRFERNSMVARSSGPRAVALIGHGGTLYQCSLPESTMRNPGPAACAVAQHGTRQMLVAASETAGEGLVWELVQFQGTAPPVGTWQSVHWGPTHGTVQQPSRIPLLAALANGQITIVLPGDTTVRVFDWFPQHLAESSREWASRAGIPTRQTNKAESSAELAESSLPSLPGNRPGRKLDPNDAQTERGSLNVRDPSFRLRDERGEHTRVVGSKDERAVHHARLAAFEKEHLDIPPGDLARYAAMAEQTLRHARTLRATVQALVQPGRERIRVFRQTHGELDEQRLVAAVAGETAVFRRSVPPTAAQQAARTHKTRIVLSVDLSASMARFNDHDRRLDRALESALLVMQAFRGLEDAFPYALVAHSGDTSMLVLVDTPTYPKSDNAAFAVLRRMELHAAHCLSGDHTVAGIADAVHAAVYGAGPVARARETRLHATGGTDLQLDGPIMQADARFVLVLSDANLAQYRITPAELDGAFSLPAGHSSPILGTLILIGSVGQQAEKLAAALPRRAAVCLDSSQLVLQIQQLLSLGVSPLGRSRL